MDELAPSRRSSIPGTLSFAAVGLVPGYLLIAVSVFLPTLLAGHLGMTLTVIGSAWALVRLFDIAIDPALGLLMDRTSTRLGRYRPWLLLGAPLLMAAIHALFEASPGVGFSYLVTWLFVFYLGLSVVTVAQSAWAANLAPGYDDRSRLFGLVAMAGVIGGVAVLAFPLLAKPMGWTSAQAVQAMGWFVLGLVPAVVGWACLRTAEHNAPEAEPVRAREVLALLSKADLLRLLAAQVTLTLGPMWMSSLYIFFTKARGFTLSAASVLLLAYMLAGVAGALVTSRLAVRFGKHRTLIAAATAFSLGLCSVAVLPKANLLATLPAMAWAGFMGAGFDMMIRAMLADVADEVRLEHGRDQISLIYGLNSAANKVAAAMAIGLTFPFLAWVGFNPAEGAANAPRAIAGLELAFICGPIVFVMLGGLSVAGWRLGPERHAQILAALAERDANAHPTPVADFQNTPLTLRRRTCRRFRLCALGAGD